MITADSSRYTNVGRESALLFFNRDCCNPDFENLRVDVACYVMEESGTAWLPIILRSFSTTANTDPATRLVRIKLLRWVLPCWRVEARMDSVVQNAQTLRHLVNFLLLKKLVLTTGYYFGLLSLFRLTFLCLLTAIVGLLYLFLAYANINSSISGALPFTVGLWFTVDVIWVRFLRLYHRITETTVSSFS